MPRKSPELIRLTKRTVDALKPGATMRDVYDNSLKGFHVQVWPSGAKTFAIRYRDPSSQGAKARYFRFKLGEYPALTVEEAREAAEAARATVNRGESPATKRADLKAAPTVGEKIPAYLAHLRRQGKKASYTNETERLLDKHAGPITHRKVREVTRADVADLLAPIREDHAPLANAVRMALSGFFTWASAEGLRLELVNPVTDTIREKQRKRTRVLTSDERTAFATAVARSAVPWQAAGIAWLLAHTGMRREEAVRLRWDSRETMPGGTPVPEGCFFLQDTKTGANLRPVCGPTVAAKLEEFRRLALQDAKRTGAAKLARSPYVFPSPRTPETWYRAFVDHWPALIEAAGLDDPKLVPHELRHDFRSALGSLSKAEADLAGGWKGEGMSDRYFHASPEMLTALSVRIDAIRAPQLRPKADTTPVVSITGERLTA
jgi:integrase